MDLQVKNGKDLTNSTPPSAPSTRLTGLSKFDRLPRLVLPDFDGTPIGWRPFWEKFQNALSKDTGLTDVDKLAFLNMAVKGEEAKLIIESKTRSGPDYDGTIQALQDRYDQPRQTCRTSLQSVLNHRIDLSSESITKTITLFQTSLAVVKELHGRFTGIPLHSVMRTTDAREAIPELGRGVVQNEENSRFRPLG